MKRLYPLILILGLFISACSSKKDLVTNPLIQDGKSYETAIVINETNGTKGVGAEYKWLAEKYPGYTSRGQALFTHNKKPYDVLHITTSDNKQVDIYFDISKFFGKF